MSAMLAFAVILLPALVATRPVHAQTFTLLHTFAGAPDGAYPLAGLVQDAAGNLYGTTSQGGITAGVCTDANAGRNGCGIVFKLDPTGTETVLYRFTGGADGLAPNGLVRDAAGNLYGTTSGGASGSGSVFKLDLSGTLTVLHSSGSSGGLVMDSAGNLYGTSSDGIFKLDPAGTFTVLDASAGSAAPLAVDPAGNLYGTVEFGGNTGGACGNKGCGTVFKLDKSGAYTVLYSFPGVGDDGYQPAAGLILDGTGNLYGTTTAGGAPNCVGGQNNPVGCGIVFKLSPTGAETVLSLRGGDYPVAGLVFDTAGNLYGTTKFTDSGGSDGVVFKMHPNGVETELHFFTGLPDGQWPLAGVALDPLGNVYGTTSTGGPLALGTVFKINPTGPQNFPLAVVIFGSGTVTGNGVDCSSNCATWVSSGTMFTLTATAAAGSSFVGWVAPPCSGTGTCSVTIDSAQTVGATFDSDFSVSATALTPAAVSPGASSTSTISVVAAASGFFSSVALTCSVQPTPALAPTCSISPGSAMPGTPATLTVRTTAPTSVVMSYGRGSGLFYALFLPLIGLVATGLRLGSERKARKGKLISAALVCVLFAGLVFQVACGGGSNNGGGGSSGTPPGAYTITVTGTYVTGSLAHSTPTTLTVQ
jgi:uncharacterized repeat protein (TIGR03803 family)